MLQPFRKTVVRIPGPSWRQNFCISKIIPIFPHNLGSKRSTSDNFFLYHGIQFYKAGTDATDPDNQVLLFLGMLLGFDQVILSNYHQIQLTAIIHEKCLDKLFHFIKLVCKQFFCKTDVINHAGMQ